MDKGIVGFVTSIYCRRNTCLEKNEIEKKKEYESIRICFSGEKTPAPDKFWILLINSRIFLMRKIRFRIQFFKSIVLTLHAPAFIRTHCRETHMHHRVEPLRFPLIQFFKHGIAFPRISKAHTSIFAVYILFSQTLCGSIHKMKLSCAPKWNEENKEEEQKRKKKDDFIREIVHFRKTIFSIKPSFISKQISRALILFVLPVFYFPVYKKLFYSTIHNILFSLLFC